MLEIIPIKIILLYSFFSTFLYYQQLHFKNFRGSSILLESILGISITVGMISGLIFLIYYGIKVVWWAPLVLFIMGILFQIIATFIESFVGMFKLSLAGFIGWPVCLYFLFILIPIK